MKSKLIVAATCLTLITAASAYAEDTDTNAAKPTPEQIKRRGEFIEHRMDKRGDRIEGHLDRKGDRIETRMDTLAAKQRAAGHEEKADMLEKRGDAVNKHLDNKGKRIDHRLDRRGERIEHRHYVRAKHAK